MTNEELNSLERLYSKFTEECERVGKIISKVHWDITSDYGEAPDCCNWSIYDGTVYGNGTDNDGDGIYCEFPTKYLTMSDSELTDMINKMNADYLEEKHRKEEEEKRKREEQKTIRELAELKRLKEKYEQGE